MKEDSPLSGIYVGMLTTAVETLTEFAQLPLDPFEDDNETIKLVNSIRSQAVLNIMNVANQLRNHARLDDIVADKELAKSYFAGSRPLQN